MFYVAPFGLIALLALDRRRGWHVWAAAAVAGVLPPAIPFSRFVNPSAVSDTFALLPWWWLQDRGIHFDTLRLVALGAGLAAAALFVVVPRRLVVALALVVAAYFVLTTAVVENGRHGIRQASAGSLWAGIKRSHADWIDRAVGRDTTVTVVWVASPEPHPLYETEFFNRSIRRYAVLGHDIWTGGLPQAQLHERGDGVLVDGRRVPLRAGTVLAPIALGLAGRTIASDSQVGLAVQRVNGELVVLTKVTGLYPDTWSGRTVTYLRRRCSRGYVSALLQSDEQLFDADQNVSDGRGHRVAVPPDGQSHRFLVPLRRGPGHTCTARFTVSTLRVPARVQPGSTDTRALGIHFQRFDYLP